jgi:hypothetical protein
LRKENCDYFKVVLIKNLEECEMRKTLFVVCLLAFTLLAQTKPEKDHTKYFPLQLNSLWKYEWEKNGSVISSTKIFIINKKDGDFILDKELYFTNMGFPIASETRYTVRNQMLLETGYAGGIFGEPYKPFMSCPIILKFPITVGAKWDYEKDGGQKIFLKVIKWHDTFKTKYGVYNDVYEVSEKTIDGEMTLYRFIYYAYGVGMVQEEISDNGSETGTRSPMNVLISYKVLE